MSHCVHWLEDDVRMLLPCLNVVAHGPFFFFFWFELSFFFFTFRWSSRSLSLLWSVIRSVFLFSFLLHLAAATARVWDCCLVFKDFPSTLAFSLLACISVTASGRRRCVQLEKWDLPSQWAKDGTLEYSDGSGGIRMGNHPRSGGWLLRLHISAVYWCEGTSLSLSHFCFVCLQEVVTPKRK